MIKVRRGRSRSFLSIPLHKTSFNLQMTKWDKEQVHVPIALIYKGSSEEWMAEINVSIYKLITFLFIKLAIFIMKQLFQSISL